MTGKHERQDANVRQLVGFGIGLAALVVVAMVAMGLLFRYLAAQDEAAGEDRSLLAAAEEPAPEPKLQVTPSTDLEKQQAAAEAVLNSYGWVDRDSGLVRIPIERAMDLIAERGLGAAPGGEGMR